MARKKKATSNDGQAPGAGHNKSALTEDEMRVLLYGHKAKLDAIEAKMTALKSEKRAAEDLAKSEYGKGAVKDIKELRLLEMANSDAALRADLEHRAKLARWANLPIGTQVSFSDFDGTPAEDVARELGKTAGLKGTPLKPPYDPSVPQYQAWIGGWHTGQEVAMSDWREKLKPTNEQPADEQKDLSERTDLAGDADLVMTEHPPADVSSPPFNEPVSA